MKYIIEGYTGPNPDFTDTVEVPDSFKLADLDYGYHSDTLAAYEILKPLLSNTAITTAYLEVYDHDYDFELRRDLAEHDGQIVLLARAHGCENCQAQGHSEYIDGCDDVPHGDFMLVLEPVQGA